ncbi:MAG: urea amidolyase associated protein UAAP1 [Pseudomonadota bacterium]
MNMTSPDTLKSDTYAAQRARYEALYARGRAARRDFADAVGNPAVIDPALVVASETLPANWGTSMIVARGQTLRIIAGDKTQGISVLLYRADEPTERLNVGDTVKVQWSAKLHKGKLLYSDMGRVLASITDDTYSHHDALAGGSTTATNIRKYGHDQARHTRGNFILLASKHGLSKSDIPPCVTFFAPVSVTGSGAFVWAGPSVKDGDYVDLRAELDVLVFVSNCPHPLSPSMDEPSPVDLMRWKSPAALPDDFCRTSCEEAVRGFENTDALVGLGAQLAKGA